MTKLSKCIKELRQQRKLTQLELAKEIEIDDSYLSKIENNRVKSIPEALVKRFALFFNIDPVELIYLSGKVPEEHQQIFLKEKQKEILGYAKDGVIQ